MTVPFFFPVATNGRSGTIQRGSAVSNQEDGILLEEVAGCVQRGKSGKSVLFQDGTAIRQAVGALTEHGAESRNSRSAGIR